LDDAGVRWALLRGNTGGDDVDVLVDAAQLATAAAVMAVHGLIELAAYGRGTHTFFLGLDEAAGSWVEFDVVTDLSFGRRTEFRTTAAPAYLDRRRREDGVWVLNPEDEFWTLLLHCVLDKRDFAERHLRRLQALAPVTSGDSPLIRALPSEEGQEALRAHRDALRGPTPLMTGSSVARAWWRATPIAVTRAYGFSAALRLVERPLQAWSRRGASVALLGPDGTGKSVLASGLADRFYFPVRTVYMGLWKRAKTPVGPDSAVLEIARRPALTWARYLAALRHRATGRLVVFDRYVYDALPPHGPLIWLKRPHLALLAHCPAPNLVVLLDSPGDIMHARSGEYDSAQLEAERAAYRRIAGRLPRVAYVDVNRPADIVLREVLGHVWRLYRDRGTR
jgi:thymidylate kinase